MSTPHESVFRHLQFYTTAPYPCSYLPGRMARSEVVAPAHLVNAGTYDRLIEQGFRRSGLFIYRPACQTCQACIPIRVDTRAFVRNRTQHKLWHHMNAQLQARISPPHWDETHFRLYLGYQRARHRGSGMDEDDPAQYTQFLLHSQVRSSLVEFHDHTGVLRMVAIIDRLDQGLSAVYTFYDPDYPGSLGTYAILWQIEYCRQHRQPWLYLGYWIAESRKMAYKTRFRPHQILQDGHWITPDTAF